MELLVASYGLRGACLPACWQAGTRNFVYSLIIYTFATRKKGCFSDWGRESPILLIYGVYSIEKIRSVLGPVLEQSGLFLVDLTIGKNNHIKVLIDSEQGINVEECVEVSRYLESKLDRDLEDFELVVSSPGVGEPLKVFRQYVQNLGRTVKVETVNNEHIEGKLMEAGEDFVILLTEKPVKDGTKNKMKVEKKRIPFDKIRSTRVIIKF